MEYIILNPLSRVYHIYSTNSSMPRTEYRALTIRVETYDRIVSTVHKIKKKKPRMYTSDFLDMLLDTYGKKT